jgi:hypothetical protein
MRNFFGLNAFRQLMATVFSLLFFVLAVALAVMTAEALFNGLTGQIGLTEALLKAINMAIVALATFELGLVVNKEYAGRDDEGHITTVLQRTLPRFVSIVCIALVLEGLLMVIKYSQLDLAGNLYYPVAVISSAALLLAALGVFLRLAAPHHTDATCGTLQPPETSPAPDNACLLRT